MLALAPLVVLGQSLQIHLVERHSLQGVELLALGAELDTLLALAQVAAAVKAETLAIPSTSATHPLGHRVAQVVVVLSHM
jgi:hypothetical protein